MAGRNKDLREGTAIIFADGEERTVYPLTIRQLRKFNKVVAGLQTEETTEIDDDQITNMVEAVSIALERDYPDIAKDKDGLEDIVDMKSFNAVLMSAMGVDPNG